MGKGCSVILTRETAEGWAANSAGTIAVYCVLQLLSPKRMLGVRDPTGLDYRLLCFDASHFYALLPVGLDRAHHRQTFFDTRGFFFLALWTKQKQCLPYLFSLFHLLPENDGLGHRHIGR